MKNTILNQLMGLRMNGVTNEITNNDMDYSEIIRRSNAYSDKLETLQLPKEVRLLVDRYVSEQNALGSHYGIFQIFRQRHQGTKYIPETENSIR